MIQFKDLANTILITATPSISPVVGNNPGYKLYYYALKNSVITDYLTYFYPLGKNKWQLEYDFNQTYQPNCQACKLEQGLKQLSKNLLSLKKYQQFFSVNRVSPIFSDLTYPALICDLKIVNYADYKAMC